MWLTIVNLLINKLMTKTVKNLISYLNVECGIFGLHYRFNLLNLADLVF